MTRAQIEILNKVKEISKTTPGGEKFFDRLDGEIIDNASKEVMSDLFDLVPEGNLLILSGGFGKKVADDIDKGKLPKMTYFLFKGGIRSGASPEFIRARNFDMDEDFESTRYATFMDDSIYGGATYEALKKALPPVIKIVDCVVIYDGCPVKKDDVKSIFRYYDHFKTKPNFKF